MMHSKIALFLLTLSLSVSECIAARLALGQEEEEEAALSQETVMGEALRITRVLEEEGQGYFLNDNAKPSNDLEGTKEQRRQLLDFVNAVIQQLEQSRSGHLNRLDLVPFCHEASHTASKLVSGFADWAKTSGFEDRHLTGEASWALTATQKEIHWLCKGGHTKDHQDPNGFVDPVSGLKQVYDSFSESLQCKAGMVPCVNGDVVGERPDCQCRCHIGWAEENCGKPTCAVDCGPHGSCTSPDHCTCIEEDWTTPEGGAPCSLLHEFKWRVGEWDTCSAEKGHRGTRQRNVQCQRNDGTFVQNVFTECVTAACSTGCAERNQPNSTEPCCTPFEMSDFPYTNCGVKSDGCGGELDFGVCDLPPLDSTAKTGRPYPPVTLFLQRLLGQTSSAMKKRDFGPPAFCSDAQQKISLLKEEVSSVDHSTPWALKEAQREVMYLCSSDWSKMSMEDRQQKLEEHHDALLEVVNQYVGSGSPSEEQPTEDDSSEQPVEEASEEPEPVLKATAHQVLPRRKHVGGFSMAEKASMHLKPWQNYFDVAAKMDSDFPSNGKMLPPTSADVDRPKHKGMSATTLWHSKREHLWDGWGRRATKEAPDISSEFDTQDLEPLPPAAPSPQTPAAVTASVAPAPSMPTAAAANSMHKSSAEQPPTHKGRVALRLRHQLGESSPFAKPSSKMSNDAKSHAHHTQRGGKIKHGGTEKNHGMQRKHAGGPLSKAATSKLHRSDDMRTGLRPPDTRRSLPTAQDEDGDEDLERQLQVELASESKEEQMDSTWVQDAFSTETAKPANAVTAAAMAMENQIEDLREQNAALRRKLKHAHGTAHGSHVKRRLRMNTPSHENAPQAFASEAEVASLRAENKRLWKTLGRAWQHEGRAWRAEASHLRRLSAHVHKLEQEQQLIREDEQPWGAQEEEQLQEQRDQLEDREQVQDQDEIEEQDLQPYPSIPHRQMQGLSLAARSNDMHWRQFWHRAQSIDSDVSEALDEPEDSPRALLGQLLGDLSSTD